MGNEAYPPCPPSPSPLVILTLLLSVTKRKGKNLVVLRVNSAKGQAGCEIASSLPLLTMTKEGGPAMTEDMKEQSAVSSQQSAVSGWRSADSYQQESKSQNAK